MSPDHDFAKYPLDSECHTLDGKVYVHRQEGWVLLNEAPKRCSDCTYTGDLDLCPVYAAQMLSNNVVVNDPHYCQLAIAEKLEAATVEHLAHMQAYDGATSVISTQAAGQLNIESLPEYKFRNYTDTPEQQALDELRWTRRLLRIFWGR